jgi:dephospho-CoA kinase
VNASPLVIALTGLPSSGKGEAAKALQEIAAQDGLSAGHLSFSDQIKEEALRRGVSRESFTRELLSRVGIEMRQAEGPGVLSARIARRICEWPAPRPQIFVADGLRHPGEIDELRRAFGDRFVLVAVEAEPKEIARRLIARRRADESPAAMRSEAQAMALLQQELDGQLSAMGPNVRTCAERADLRLPNHGTLDDLKRNVQWMYNTFKARLQD